MKWASALILGSIWAALALHFELVWYGVAIWALFGAVAGAGLSQSVIEVRSRRSAR